MHLGEIQSIKIIRLIASKGRHLIVSATVVGTHQRVGAKISDHGRWLAIDWIGRNQHQIVGGLVEGDLFGAAWVHESKASLFYWFEMVQLGVSSHFQSK